MLKTFKAAREKDKGGYPLHLPGQYRQHLLEAGLGPPELCARCQWFTGYQLSRSC
jgi:hypothetical protein